MCETPKRSNAERCADKSKSKEFHKNIRSAKCLFCSLMKTALIPVLGKEEANETLPDAALFRKAYNVMC